MFKLPIEYIEHSITDQHVIDDLELIESSDIPIYHRIFKPKTDESKKMACQWAKHHTTDTTFLEETTSLIKSFNVTSTPIDPFVTAWSTMRNNNKFKLSHQYVESPYLKGLNMSPKFLMCISLYFIASPILFLLTPLIMILIPFAMLRARGETITWEVYVDILKSIMKQHAIGGLISGFQDADNKKRAYLIGTALIFCAQLYSNVHTFYTFYTTMTTIHDTFNTTNIYLKKTIDKMTQTQKNMQNLSKYKLFYDDLEKQKTILMDYYDRSITVRKELWQCGICRALFYELYDNEELAQALTYSIDFHGYIQNMGAIHKRVLKRNINPCVFSDVTTFVNAKYPIKNPVKNTYSLDHNIIITGQNASGKTTLLKTTIINVLLSQQIGCGMYTSATINPYKIISCYINIPDTSGRDSLFQAEARRCKEVLTVVQTNVRILCVFDELFSGTNPDEAIASASALLGFMANYTACRFLMTTHYVGVCKDLDSSPTIDMMHMECKDSTFTFKLVDGISYVKGGVKVLEQFKYPEKIITDTLMRTNMPIFNN